MPFMETPRFPEDIAYGATGGPEFSTDIVALNSGFEQRNKNWPDPRRKYDVSSGVKSKTEFDVLLAYFLNVGGRHGEFRFKDWLDYEVTTSNGRLGTSAVGTGYPTYQLYKRYSSGANNYDRVLKKPVSGTPIIYRNAAAQTAGASPGNYSLDTTTGIVTFVADSTKTITGITQANPAVVTSASHGFTNGQLIYISGVAGMTQVNNLAFTVAGAATNTFQLQGINSTTYSAYTSGGTAAKYPQPADALTWAGQFDVPVRFDTDVMAVSIEDIGAYNWGQIMLIEVRL